jgi:hypothetical protein
MTRAHLPLKMLPERAPSSFQPRTTMLVPRFARHEPASPAGGQESPVANHVGSKGHSVRLETAVSRRKQKLGTRSNRHFFAGVARKFRPAHGFCATATVGRALGVITGPASLQFFNRELHSRGEARGKRSIRQEPRGYRSPITNHASPRAVTTLFLPPTPNIPSTGL